jgi:hypothetical protein
MKQTLVLFAASAFLYSCSPKLSGSVANSTSNSSSNTSKTETSTAPALQSGNATDAAQPATAIQAK